MVRRWGRALGLNVGGFMAGSKSLLTFLFTTTSLAISNLHGFAQESVVRDPVVVQEDASPSGEFDGYLPEASSSATKDSVPLKKIPQAISVVGSEQIKDQAARSVVEATRYSPGIRSETFGNDTRNDWFLIRGFTAQVNSYFLDGLQLQSSDSFATWKINPYLLDRIDILRGPSAALYGASNPGGLINMVSKRPTFRNGGEVSVGVNEYGNVWSGFDAEGVNETQTLAYRFVATGNYGDTAVDFTNNDQYALMPVLTWAPDADTTVTAYASIQKLKTRGQNFLPYVGTVVDAPFGRIPRDLFTSEPDYDKFERFEAMVGYEAEHHFTDNLTVRQNLRYAHIDVDFFNVYGTGYVTAPTETSAILDRTNFMSVPELGLFNVDTQLEWKVATGPLQHTWLFGIDYKRFDLDDESGFQSGPPLDLLNPIYAPPPPVTLRYDQSSTLQRQTGAYLQDRIEFDRWNFVLSGRYDSVDTEVTDRPTGARTDYSADAFSGRAGVIYNFDNGLSPYVNVSHSFLPLTGTDSVTNQPFEPEEGMQYEAGLRYQPESWNGSLIGLSVFDLTRENVVTSDGILFNRQIGEVSSRGFELEAVGQITPDLKLIGAYTWYDLEIQKGNPSEIGKVTTGTPEQIGSLWLDYAVPSGRLEGVSVGAGLRYVGSSYADAANTLKVPDVVLFDAALRYERENIEAALNVSNLFDKEYVASCNVTCFYGESREVNLTLSYKW